MVWVDAAVQGVLLGGLYALFATGLSVTFGLSIVIQNGLLEIFSADSRRLNPGGIETASVPLGGGLAVGAFPLLTFALAVVLLIALQLVIGRSPIGRAFRAASDDGATA